MNRCLFLIFGLFLAACSPVDVLNSLVSSDGYRVERDIAYAEGPRHKLDLYLPDTVNETTAVVVFFYGGRWEEGNKEKYLFAAQGLVSLGYIVAIPDYRLYPQIKYPAFLHDSADAVTWVYKNIGKYGGNPKNLYVMGHSAGAYNAMMIGLNPAYMKQAGGSSSWIRGVIGLAGPYDFLPFEDQDIIDIFSTEKDLKKTQPITYVSKHMPRALLLTGDIDDKVKIKNSQNLYTALKAQGNDVTIKEYEGVGHIAMARGLSPLVTPDPRIRKDITAFIDRR